MKAKEGGLTENQALQPPVQCPCSPPMTASSPSLAKGTDLIHVPGGGGAGVTPAPGCIPHPGSKTSIAHLSRFLPSLQRAETTCYGGKEILAQRRTERLKGYSLHGIQDWQLSEPTRVHVAPQDQATTV